ncbi:AAA family ATPase [Desulfogranum japonicum]|uniref:AAA family ATPase n=1 Tax=Desulfogranum japonicum TaxID=231447 RepID=UPI00041702D2|nr:MoxR family ATPase [Desulfogranum japonicum]
MSVPTTSKENHDVFHDKKELAAIFSSLEQRVSSYVLGKELQVKLSLCCLLAQGHLLIEDIPGIGKTTLAKVLARILGLEFQRIQCTNDMLPGDILGVAVFDPKSGSFSFHKGPVFTQILLADEINRTTPKTQSALLEAMEEHQVSIEGETRMLPNPFFVMATQNPLEQAGTYPLPESQLDRFLFRISIGYPSKEAENRLLRGGGIQDEVAKAQPLLGPDQVLNLQQMVMNVHLSDPLVTYIQNLLEYSRNSGLFSLGLSPRAGLSLARAGQAWALISGRDYVIPEDIQQVLPYVAIHRLHQTDTMTEMPFDDLVTSFQAVAVPT